MSDIEYDVSYDSSDSDLESNNHVDYSDFEDGRRRSNNRRFQSTALVEGRENENFHQPPRESLEDHMARVPENTSSTAGHSLMGNDGSKFMHRMTSAKTLPTFSGDPWEWTRFKQAFELSTALGDYSEAENILRLSEALKEEARDATSALLIAENDPYEIIKTLEMRFGNPKLILNKIMRDIKELPIITSHNDSIVECATNLKNSVGAIKLVENSHGYLCNPELVESILKKMPESIYRRYIDYAEKEGRSKPDLERIADFLFLEAQKYVGAGVIFYEDKKSSTQ